MAASFDQIGQQFVQTYYTTFDTNRPALSTLYVCSFLSFFFSLTQYFSRFVLFHPISKPQQPQSMLTMGNKQHVGPQAVLECLQALGGKTSHQVEALDCQPTARGGVLVVVTGKISIDDAPPMNFNQTFQLFPVGSGYCILNDIFSLNLS